ncbi:MAG: flagellar biosynthesis protein FliQ [Oscillospiraceae bacterium]
MTQDEVLAVFKEALWIVLELSGPMLIISIVVGLVISIIQAATQVHEQTLTFVPKVLAIAVILLLTAPWMMNVLNDFTIKLFDIISKL